MNKIAIEAKKVIKITNKNDWKLRNLDLRLYFGDVVAIIGPTNSGKYTLARLLAGEIRPTFGNIYYGIDSIKSGDIGLQFRQTVWPFGFIVKDIINLFISIYKINDDQWLHKLYDVFKIKDFINERLDTIDLIWAQTFNIFLTFLSKPKILVIDSIPTTIGVFMRKNIISFIKEYKNENNACVIIVSPDPDLFSQICNKIILMYKGTIVKTEDIKGEPSTELFYSYLDNITELVKGGIDDKVKDERFKHYLSQLKELTTLYNNFYETYISKYFTSKIIDNKKILFNINKWKYYLEKLYKILYLIGDDINTKNNISIFKKTIKEFENIYNKAITENTKRIKSNIDIDNFMKISDKLSVFFSDDILKVKELISESESRIRNTDKELEKYKKKIILEEEKILKKLR